MLLRLLEHLKKAFLPRKELARDRPAVTQDGWASSGAAVSEENARRAVELMPNFAEAHNNLGCVYAKTKRLAAAEAEFLLATKLARSNADAHFNLGNVLVATNRLSGAEAAYRRAIELKPTFAQAHRGLGVVLAASRRQKEAEASYRLALKLMPDFAAARENLDELLEEIERLAEIEAAHRRTLESAPNSAEAHCRLGAFLIESGRLSEAEAVFRRLIELEPENAGAQLNLGVILQNTNHPFAAEEVYRHTLELAPDFADAHHNLGLVLAQTRRLSEAEATYRRALALNPDFASAHNNLGLILTETNRLGEAQASFRQAITAAPDFEEARNNLDHVLQETKRLSESVAACRRDLKLAASDARSYDKLGAALMALGRLDEAVAAFKQALALNREFAEAHNKLGMAYLIQDEVDSAIACFLRATSIRQDYSKAMSNLGAAFFIKEDVPNALIWNQAALAVNANQVEANRNMALISLQAGKLDEAKQYLDRARSSPSLGVEIAPNPLRTVLLLGAASLGNVPPLTIEIVFPANLNTRITWVAELADDDQADELPRYDLVFNAMGDPDMTGDVQGPLRRFLGTCTKPVLNPPDKVARTARHMLPSLLEGIDQLLVPTVWRFSSSSDWEDSIADQLPLLIRPVNSHGGTGLVLARTAEELAQSRDKQSGPVYLTRYVDFRSRNGYFRKYRIIFVDRKPYPYHLAISQDWMVHYYTAEMEPHPWKLEEEKAFLQNPDAVLGNAGMQAIQAIGARMDLDYAGIDFSIMPDGRILVFEANPMMLIHPEILYGPLDHKNAYVFGITAKFEEMLKRRTSAVAEN